MFGSDWPVCLLAATYDTVVAAARETLAGLTDSDPVLLDFSPRKKAYLNLVPPGGNRRCFLECLLHTVEEAAQLIIQAVRSGRLDLRKDIENGLQSLS